MNSTLCGEVFCKCESCCLCLSIGEKLLMMRIIVLFLQLLDLERRGALTHRRSKCSNLICFGYVLVLLVLDHFFFLISWAELHNYVKFWIRLISIKIAKLFVFLFVSKFCSCLILVYDLHSLVVGIVKFNVQFNRFGIWGSTSL